MLKSEKERVVAELTEQLRRSDSLIVADYRGLTNSELEELRDKLRPHGARLTIVKNTLTRRAAEAAGADALLTLLEGPTAIAFVEAEGDPVAVAKALADTARQTKIMTLRGGVLQGAAMTGDQVDTLAKLPPLDVLRSQVVGVIIAPLTQLLGLLTAPLRDLVGVIDARITQLEEQGDDSGAAAAAVVTAEPPAEAAPTEAAADGPPAADEPPAATEDTEAPEAAASAEEETDSAAPQPEAAQAEAARAEAAQAEAAPGEAENDETENNEEE